MKRRLWKFAQIILTPVFLYFAFRQVEWAGVVDTLKRADPLWVLAGLACMAASAWVQALRWKVMAPDLGIGVLKYLYFIFVGFFFNFFLPGASTGDAVKVFLFGKKYGGILHNALLFAFAKMVGFAIQALTGGVALLLLWKKVRPMLSQGLQIDWIHNGKSLLVLVAIVALGVAFYLFRGYWPRLYDSIPKAMLAIRSGKTLAWVFVHTTAVQLLSYLNAWFVFKSLGLAIDFKAILLVQSITTFALVFPITIGGLGIREIVNLTMYGGVGGIPKSDVLALIMIGYVSLAVFAALGGGWILFRKWTGRSESLQLTENPSLRE